MARGFCSGITRIVSLRRFPSLSTQMKLSPWITMVTLFITSGSETPFHSEDSIRQLPWSLSNSLLATSRDAAGGAAAGGRSREQAGMLNKMRTTNNKGGHFIALPPNIMEGGRMDRTGARHRWSTKWGRRGASPFRPRKSRGNGLLLWQRGQRHANVRIVPGRRIGGAAPSVISTVDAD